MKRLGKILATILFISSHLLAFGRGHGETRHINDVRINSRILLHLIITPNRTLYMATPKEPNIKVARLSSG